MIVRFSDRFVALAAVVPRTETVAWARSDPLRRFRSRLAVFVSLTCTVARFPARRRTDLLPSFFARFARPTVRSRRVALPARAQRTRRRMTPRLFILGR